jgi:hypothetical protein
MMTEIDCGNIISKQGNVMTNEKALGEIPNISPV